MTDALNKLGIVYDEVDETYTIRVDGVEISYYILFEAVWNGIFGFCCCGDPATQLIKIYNLLSAMDEELPVKPKEEDIIYLYLLDSKRMTEHGCSIHFSWINNRGRALMKIIKVIVRTEKNKNEQP